MMVDDGGNTGFFWHPRTIHISTVSVTHPRVTHGHEISCEPILIASIQRRLAIVAHIAATLFARHAMTVAAPHKSQTDANRTQRSARLQNPPEQRWPHIVQLPTAPSSSDAADETASGAALDDEPEADEAPYTVVGWVDTKAATVSASAHSHFIKTPQCMNRDDS